MTFLEPNQVALDRWDTLLAEGRRVVGTGGCDAHENAFPQLLTDGERADSYRRMMSWITNHLLVDEHTPAAYESALAEGRVFEFFEFFEFFVVNPMAPFRLSDAARQPAASACDTGSDLRVKSEVSIAAGRHLINSGLPNGV